MTKTNYPKIKITERVKNLVKTRIKNTNDIKKFASIKLDYDKAGLFMHCKHCYTEWDAGKFGQGLSPVEALHEEFSDYTIKMPNGKYARIVVVWCNRCKRQIWDSRHLTNLY